MRGELSLLKKVLDKLNPRFIQQARGAGAVESIWQIRREFSFALRDTGLVKLNEDIVVPRGQLEALFAFSARLQKKHGLPIACFGHAGDGNIHTNVMVNDREPGHVKKRVAALDELFTWVLAHDGAITGEHGIGLAKKRWWPWAAGKETRQLHAAVKDALDPKGILNPGKFL